MGIKIDRETCNGCGECVEICPEDVLSMDGEFPVPLREEECWYCGACMMDCPVDAVDVVFPVHMQPVILRGADRDA